MNLSGLVKARNVTSWTEPLLEKGVVYNFHAHTWDYGPTVCWRPPAEGTAIVEIWGAGGSSSCWNCCGGTLGPKPGAYVKKHIKYTGTDYQGSYICAELGASCCHGACYAACSSAACIRIQYKCCAESDSCCSCICVEGGYGGMWYCGDNDMVSWINGNTPRIDYDSSTSRMDGGGSFCEALVWNHCCKSWQACIYQNGRYYICENDIYSVPGCTGTRSYSRALGCDQQCCTWSCIRMPAGWFTTGPSFVRHTTSCTCCGVAQGAYDSWHYSLVNLGRNGVEGHQIGTQEDCKHHNCFCRYGDPPNFCHRHPGPGMPGPNLGHGQENWCNTGASGGNSAMRITWIEGE